MAFHAGLEASTIQVSSETSTSGFVATVIVYPSGHSEHVIPSFHACVRAKFVAFATFCLISIVFVLFPISWSGIVVARGAVSRAFVSSQPPHAAKLAASTRAGAEL